MRVMNGTLGEHISAFLDGELPERELELLLKRLDREAHLRETLARYSLIGECLRGEPDRLSRSFTARVCKAVASEARARKPVTVQAPVTLPQASWMGRTARLAGGFAIAASVAAAAILALQWQPSPVSSPEQANHLQLVAQIPSASRETENVIGGSGGANAETFSYTVPAPVKKSTIVPEARLTDYVFAHSEFSSPLGRRNVLSSVIAEDPTPVESSDNRSTKSKNKKDSQTEGLAGGERL